LQVTITLESSTQTHTHKRLPPPSYLKYRTGQVPLQTSGGALLICHKAGSQAIQQASPPHPLTSSTGRARSHSRQVVEPSSSATRRGARPSSRLRPHTLLPEVLDGPGPTPDEWWSPLHLPQGSVRGHDFLPFPPPSLTSRTGRARSRSRRVVDPSSSATRQ
jgi:hypothetical protein